jgi:hypothetical protein
VRQQELLQRLCDLIALALVKRLQKHFVCGDDRLAGLLGNPFAPSGQPHPHAFRSCNGMTVTLGRGNYVRSHRDLVMRATGVAGG